MPRRASRTAAALALMLGVLALAACSGGGDESDAPAPDPNATSYPLPADAQPYEGPTVPVQGLFTEPRETIVDRVRNLPPEPHSTFSEWDGTSVVLYDLDMNWGAETDLGEGNIGFSPFSPDSEWLVWVVPSGTAPTGRWVTSGEVRVLELATGEQRSYGDGSLPSFASDGTLTFSTTAGGGRERVRVDPATGERTVIESAETERQVLGAQYPFGYRIQTIPPAVVLFGDATARTLIVPDDGSPALEVTGAPGTGAAGLDANRVLVMVAAAGIDPPEIGPSGGSFNIFVLDPASARATFIATALSVFPGGVALSRAGMATAEYLAWTEHWCDPERRRTLVYSHATGEITELRPAVQLSGGAEEGVLGIGFNRRRRALLDVETLEFRDVMPGPLGPVWSPDGRWAVNAPSVETAVDLCGLDLGALAAGE